MNIFFMSSTASASCIFCVFRCRRKSIFSCASFGLPLCRTARVNLLLLVSSCAARSRAGGDSRGDGERMSGMCSCGRQQEEGRESHPVWRHDQHGWTQSSRCHINTEMGGKLFRHCGFLESMSSLSTFFVIQGLPLFSQTNVLGNIRMFKFV